MAAPNKMLLMLPLMYFARKLDHTDPDLVFKLRCAFYTVQAIILSLIAYLWTQANAYQRTKDGKKKVFVTKPPEPFTDPNAKKKYTEVEIGEHMVSTIQSLAGSQAFGVAIQSGFHFYNGTIAGFASQIIMAPLNLFDNAVAKYFILGDKEAFATKTREELTTDDEIVDKDGNPIVPSKKGVVTAKKENKEEKKSFEEILLDTWDSGAEADIKPLMDALNKKNINYKTAESGWTPLMIMAGLGVKDTSAALKKMKELGADPHLTDEEGWTAMHWSAFHGCAEAAEFILSPDGFDGHQIGMHEKTDKEGMTATDHAEKENNEDVVEVIHGLNASSDKSNTVESKKDDDGLRKRK